MTGSHFYLINQVGGSNFSLAGSSHGIMGNVLDYNIEVSEFELQSHYYVHFWTQHGWRSFFLERGGVVPKNIIHHYNPKYPMDLPTDQLNINKICQITLRKAINLCNYNL